MTISKENVLNTLNALDGAATAEEISMAMYGTDTPSRRVARTLMKLRLEGKVDYEKPSNAKGTWYIPC